MLFVGFLRSRRPWRPRTDDQIRIFTFCDPEILLTKATKSPHYLLCYAWGGHRNNTWIPELSGIRRWNRKYPKTSPWSHHTNVRNSFGDRGRSVKPRLATTEDTEGRLIPSKVTWIAIADHALGNSALQFSSYWTICISTVTINMICWN